MLTEPLFDNLNKDLAAFQRRNNARQRDANDLQQMVTRCIADSQPHDRRPIPARRAERHKIFVLGNDHLTSLGRQLPDVAVQSPLHFHVGHMHSFVPHRSEVARERWWQLRIDDETHG
jgi:hypothetical protein